ncbi:unnamed protein product [Schistosoma margrebowiei]|uniref:Uncharacterized protein n=1 Tax=Schistosoma margrebowiei TaxID=48269 RepID=A0A183MBL7_9TREM|nr:unnamed protein product [Schistosoma margrebowiei]
MFVHENKSLDISVINIPIPRDSRVKSELLEIGSPSKSINSSPDFVLKALWRTFSAS